MQRTSVTAQKASRARVCNAMTVDVEDYFHVQAFADQIDPKRWESLPARVEQNTEAVLELFESQDTRATFFVLGWIAERYPRLVKRIAEAGHEVASHGHEHRQVREQTRQEFWKDVTRTKAVLEDCTGSKVIGFRAASFSIDEETLWALDVLEEAGHEYSSSIYPVRHDLYGMPAAPRFPFRRREGGLLEVPLTTVSVLSRNWPCAGGGYFRLYPYQLSRWAINRVNQREGQAAVFYFHPWEIDPGQPRQGGIGAKTRFRHYWNLGRTKTRLVRLLTDFSWDRADRVFLEGKGCAGEAVPQAVRDDEPPGAW